MDKNSSMAVLLNTLPQVGKVEWIGVRPARREDLKEVTEVEVKIGNGLKGDRFRGKPESKRQVTLIQAEHITAIASFMKMKKLDPRILRRNIVVSGINLLALKGKFFQIGEVVLEMTGQCHPCSRMEENLGPGGYNAVRNHGGITARVIKEGKIRLGDEVKVVERE